MARVRWMKHYTERGQRNEGACCLRNTCVEYKHKSQLEYNKIILSSNSN